ncbi:MAG: amidohydrolase family protein [Kiritimatiellia bacterium]|jgi:predicted TIM-barrel fold metal-dependent hydrolase
MDGKNVRITPANLKGKVIDAHSHSGVAIPPYGRAEYPYAQTIEGLYYQQLHGGVDVNITFPFSSDLYFDLPALIAGKYKKSRSAVSKAPFQMENLLLLREVFDYCPELSCRFLPFISMDPLREPQSQARYIKKLLNKYPVYGIKINPATSQAPVIALLKKESRCLLDLAREQNWPILLHTTSQPEDQFSYVGNAFKVIDANPDIRFCLAHCIIFSKPFLDRTLATPNVWVDTAAFKIQVDVCRVLVERKDINRRDLIDADFNDHNDVMAKICADYGEKIIWGTDSPAYAYICRRRLNRTAWQEFNYKGTYDDEIRLLRRRPPAVRRKIANRNTIRFLFGTAS